MLWIVVFYLSTGLMAELVYALDSGSNRIRPVRVQVSLSPPSYN